MSVSTTEPEAVVLTPSGERLSLDERTPLSLEEPGFYELRDRRTGTRAATLAVNVDRGEASMEAFDPQELVSAVGTGAGASLQAAEAASLTLGERERQQSAWWYLIVVAFLLLAAETVLSNRATRSALAPPAPAP